MKKVPMFKNNPEKIKNGFDSAWKIRSTREMRKLTIEEVSEKTGIEKNRLQQAEKNLISLSNSEIEKVAEAIDTHPGRIAFPSWDDISFKAVRCGLNGRCLINGVEQTGKLSGYASYMGSLNLSFGGRKSLNLFTYGRIPSDRRPEMKLQIKGDSIGSLNDVFQAGPDFDGDSRNITEVQIVVSVFSNGIQYNISGLAECKFKQPCARPVDSPPGDWRFDISFLILPEQIRDFFGIYQDPAERLIKSMENIKPNT